MTEQINRRSEHKLHAALKRSPCVLLTGPRQVGKTTLAKKLNDKGVPSVYFDLENTDDLAKFKQPEQLLRRHQGKLVIIDEVQVKPTLLNSIRGMVDERRQQMDLHGHFLLLGSAPGKILRQANEALVGRLTEVELHGFDCREVSAANMFKLWDRGGLPGSYLARDDEHSVKWRKDYLTAQITRELPALGLHGDPVILRNLLILLAARQGQGVTKYATLANTLGVDYTVVKTYLSYLMELMLIRRLPAYHSNAVKAIAKSPRYYVRDSGIANHLCQTTIEPDGRVHADNAKIKGASWEGFVIENLLGAMPTDWDAFFFRTPKGSEIDLLLQRRGDRQLWAIEIKSSEDFKLEKGFYQSINKLSPARSFVVHPGHRRWDINRTGSIEAIPLSQMMDELLVLDDDSPTSTSFDPVNIRGNIEGYPMLENAITNNLPNKAILRKAFIQSCLDEIKAVNTCSPSQPLADSITQLDGIVTAVHKWVSLDSAVDQDKRQLRMFRLDLHQLLSSVLAIKTAPVFGEADRFPLEHYLHHSLFVSTIAALLENRDTASINFMLAEPYFVNKGIKRSNDFLYLDCAFDQHPAVEETITSAFKKAALANSQLVAAELICLSYTLAIGLDDISRGICRIWEPGYYSCSWPGYRQPDFFKRVQASETWLRLYLECLGKPCTQRTIKDLSVIADMLKVQLSNSAADHQTQQRIGDAMRFLDMKCWSGKLPDK